MPSPFPGMDPYLEEPFMWPDFRFGMNAALREFLNAHLPEKYVAVADRYIWIHEPEAKDRLQPVRADVHVAERKGKASSASRQPLATAPVQTILPVVSREGNRFLRILDKHSRQVITVLELLSPSNKMPGPDREAYLLKRNNFLASQANIVEFDFLRGGERMPLGEPPPPITDYYVLVFRASDFPGRDLALLGPHAVSRNIGAPEGPRGAAKALLERVFRSCVRSRSLPAGDRL